MTAAISGGRVIHTGQAIVDLVMTVAEVPAVGGDIFASSHTLAAGGGFNVMAAARREGAEVVYAGGHGTGRFADIVRTAMDDEGIEIANSADLSQDTGFCVALIDDHAERTFISTLGAEGALTAAHLDAAHVTDRDTVYLSGYSLFHETNREVIARWLPTLPAGATVVVDTSPVIADVPDAVREVVRQRADIWTANERESRILAERFGANPDAEPGELARTVADATDAIVLVRVNSGGCWVGRKSEESVLVESIEVEPVDTNGAGDAHTGVLCADLADGQELLAAVRRANIAAAISVTRPGPATSPTRAEIDARAVA